MSCAVYALKTPPGRAPEGRRPNDSFYPSKAVQVKRFWPSWTVQSPSCLVLGGTAFAMVGATRARRRVGMPRVDRALTPDLALAVQQVLVGDHLGQAHGPAGVQLLCADP